MRTLMMVLLMSGCGDKDTESGTSSTDSADSTEIDCGAELWADQSGDARSSWMAACVLPDMQALKKTVLDSVMAIEHISLVPDRRRVHVEHSGDDKCTSSGPPPRMPWD